MDAPRYARTWERCVCGCDRIRVGSRALAFTPLKLQALKGLETQKISRKRQNISRKRQNNRPPPSECRLQKSGPNMTEHERHLLLALRIWDDWRENQRWHSRALWPSRLTAPPCSSVCIRAHLWVNGGAARHMPMPLRGMPAPVGQKMAQLGTQASDRPRLSHIWWPSSPSMRGGRPQRCALRSALPGPLRGLRPQIVRRRTFELAERAVDDLRKPARSSRMPTASRPKSN